MLTFSSSASAQSCPPGFGTPADELAQQLATALIDINGTASTGLCSSEEIDEAAIDEAVEGLTANQLTSVVSGLFRGCNSPAGAAFILEESLFRYLHGRVRSGSRQSRRKLEQALVLASLDEFNAERIAAGGIVALGRLMENSIGGDTPVALIFGDGSPDCSLRGHILRLMGLVKRVTEDGTEIIATDADDSVAAVVSDRIASIISAEPQFLEKLQTPSAGEHRQHVLDYPWVGTLRAQLLRAAFDILGETLDDPLKIDSYLSVIGLSGDSIGLYEDALRAPGTVISDNNAWYRIDEDFPGEDPDAVPADARHMRVIASFLDAIPPAIARGSSIAVRDTLGRCFETEPDSAILRCRGSGDTCSSNSDCGCVSGDGCDCLATGKTGCPNTLLCVATPTERTGTSESASSLCPVLDQTCPYAPIVDPNGGEPVDSSEKFRCIEHATNTFNGSVTKRRNQFPADYCLRATHPAHDGSHCQELKVPSFCTTFAHELGHEITGLTINPDADEASPGNFQPAVEGVPLRIRRDRLVDQACEEPNQYLRNRATIDELREAGEAAEDEAASDEESELKGDRTFCGNRCNRAKYPSFSGKDFANNRCTTGPGEFFASLMNIYAADTESMLELAWQRWTRNDCSEIAIENGGCSAPGDFGYKQPINQALFAIDVMSRNDGVPTTWNSAPFFVQPERQCDFTVDTANLGRLTITDPSLRAGPINYIETPTVADHFVDDPPAKIRHYFGLSTAADTFGDVVNWCRSDLCESSDPCTRHSCNGSGQCVATTTIADGTPCVRGDGTGCGGTCLSGVCESVENGTSCGPVPGSCGALGSCVGGNCIAQGNGCTGAPPCGGTCDSDLDICGAPEGTSCSGIASNNPCTDGSAATCDGFGNCFEPPLPFATPCTDDGNPCTLDVCDSGECVHFPLSGPEHACENNLFCVPNVCIAGECADATDVTAGRILNTCQENLNKCDEICDEQADACVQEPNGSPCDVDDGTCRSNWSCQAGVCTGGTPDDSKCEDGDPCTVDTCNTAGACESSVATNGSPCDDGNFCTPSGSCLNGSCVIQGSVCNTSLGCEICNEETNTCDTLPQGTPCNSDANRCTDDTCNGLGLCEHASDTQCLGTALCGNAPLPQEDCYVLPAKGALSYRTRDGKPSATSLSWSWSTRQPAVQLADLGDPTSTSTPYAVCIYDTVPGSSASEYALDVSVQLPTGPAAASSWKQRTTGWVYKADQSASPELRQLKLNTKPNAPKMAIKLKGRGSNVPLPAGIPGGPAFFESEDVVIVQLINGEGRCWSTTYLPEKAKISPTSYKAKAN